MVQKNLFPRICFLLSAVSVVAAPLETALSDFVRAQSRLMGSLTFGIASEQGKRKEMEDAHSVVIGDGYGWYAVFDGHSGAEVAQLAARYMHRLASDVIPQRNLDFKKIFELFDQFLGKKEIAFEQGSTAVIALIQDGMLTVANLGDSRAVLCSGGKAVRITTDHKPTEPSERGRIKKITDKLAKDKKDDELCGVLPSGRLETLKLPLGSSLALSRAFGDRYYEPCISHEPDVFKRKLTPSDQFLILACDGLWDVMKDDDAVRFVVDRLKTSSPRVIAQELCTEALKRWDTYIKQGRSDYGDNVTLILVMLPPFPG